MHRFVVTGFSSQIKGIVYKYCIICLPFEQIHSKHMRQAFPLLCPYALIMNRLYLFSRTTATTVPIAA